MKANTNNINHDQLLTVECMDLLKDCITFENIEDCKRIANNLKTLELYKKVFPKEMYDEIEEFAKQKIYPIVFDASYFDFMKQREFGKQNAEGVFEINSEESIEKMCCLMKEHTLGLSKEVYKLAAKYIN